MPKISENDGPSDKRAPGYFAEGRSFQSPNVTETDDERDYVERLAGDPERPPEKQDEKDDDGTEDEKGAGSWPGNSSSPFGNSPEQNEKKNSTPRQRRVRTTENP